MLRDIDAVVAATAERRVVLFGFYNSCTHAIAWAARHPDRVAGLVLFGGSVRGWLPMSGPATQALLSLIDQDWDTFVESATHAWLGWPDDADGRLAADWFRTATTPAVARATLRAASAVDVSDEAARIRCPTLVLHREGSPVVPRSATDDLVAAIPDARLVVLPGASPTLFFEDATTVLRLLVSFVSDPSASLPAVAAPARRRTDALRAVAASAAQAGWPSPRELEVLRLIARGDSNAEIAAQLGLSINTVERHLANVYRKIDARGRADATAWAIRNGVA